MSLTRYTYLLAVVMLLMTIKSEAQMFSDQGMMSGSGLTIIPTAAIAPPYEYRLQTTRVSYLKGNTKGMNLFSITAGLSSAIEGYLRFGSEESGSFTSQVAYGFGGKFRVPMLLPVVRRLALWADITSSEQKNSSALFPSDAFRTGVSATLDSNGIHPTVLLGTARINNKTNLLIGSGVTIAAGNNKQVGFEMVYGYLGKNSLQIVSTGSMRIFSNIGIQVSPGYLSSRSGSTWSVALGLSFSTTDIDFHPVVEEKKGDEFILPTIEEMEKQSQNNGKEQPSGNEPGKEGSTPSIGVPQNQTDINGSNVQVSASKDLSVKNLLQTDSKIIKQQSEKKKQEENEK